MFYQKDANANKDSFLMILVFVEGAIFPHRTGIWILKNAYAYPNMNFLSLSLNACKKVKNVEEIRYILREDVNASNLQLKHLLKKKSLYVANALQENIKSKIKMNVWVAQMFANNAFLIDIVLAVCMVIFLKILNAQADVEIALK